MKTEPGLGRAVRQRTMTSMAETALIDISRLIAHEFVDSALPQHLLSDAAAKRTGCPDFVCALSPGAIALFERARTGETPRPHALPPLPRRLAKSCSRPQWAAAWKKAIATCHWQTPVRPGLYGRFTSPDCLAKRPSSLGPRAGVGCFATKNIAAGAILGPYGPAYCCLATEAAEIEANPVTRAGFSTYAYSTAFRHSDTRGDDTGGGRNRPRTAPPKPKRKTALVFSSWGFDTCLLGFMNSATPAPPLATVSSASASASASLSVDVKGEGGDGDGNRRKMSTPSTNNVQFCEVLLWGQFPVVWAVASRDIQSGQELFVDYGAQYWQSASVASVDRYLMDAFYRKTSAILDGLAPRFPLTVE